MGTISGAARDPAATRDFAEEVSPDSPRIRENVGDPRIPNFLEKPSQLGSPSRYPVPKPHIKEASPSRKQFQFCYKFQHGPL